jgi:hypothetical protein
MAIWAWAKKKSGIDPVTGRETGGGIDEGRSFEDVHDAINRHFYGGMVKDPAWITDKLAGRKTPLKPFALAAKIAEINRRNVTAKAQDLTNAILKQQKQGTPERVLEAAFNFPRNVAVGGHSLGLGVIHPGDLAFQPRNMGIFWTNLFHVWNKAFPLVTAKRAAEDQVNVDNYFTNKVKKNVNYDMALYSKLEVGERSHGGNLVGKQGSSSDRAWTLIKIARFKMWNSEYQLALKRNPTWTEEQKLEVAKGLAQMANHATGTSGGMPKEIAPALFGPKLTASKISRLVGDPLTTAKAIFNPNASPAERYVANRRLVRATQYLGTLAGFLGVNWGFNKATGTKDEDNVNWSNPAKADWMSFKTGGLEWSVPGLHTELKFLANVIAIGWQQTHSQKQINKESRGWGQWGELAKSVGQYQLNKIVPGGQIGLEIAMGHNFQGRPLPWVKDQTGTAYAPPYGFNPNLKGAAHVADATTEWALSHAPIPFAGPIKYVYDQLLRAKGSSAQDALSVIRALGLAGMGLTGLHANIDYEAAKAAAKREQVAKKLMARH